MRTGQIAHISCLVTCAASLAALCGLAPTTAWAEPETPHPHPESETRPSHTIYTDLGSFPLSKWETLEDRLRPSGVNATTTPLAEAIGRFERAGEGESVVQLIETEPSPRALLDFGDLTFRETELLPAGATDTDRARILRRRLADHTGAHSSADDLLRIDLSSPEPEGDDPERPTLSRGSPLLAELRAVEEGNGNGGAVSDALRVRLSQGFSIVGSGGNQSIDDEYSYFALSAGAAFQLNQRAGLEVGYDFYRRTSPSELRAIEIEDEGIFARLQFRF